MAYNIQDLLSEMVKRGASDLHITAGSPPLVRLSGKLTPLGDDKLKPDETMRMTYSLMNELQKKSFEQQKECDFSFGIANLARFRANAYLQRGCVALALRIIPLEIKTFKELGLPKILAEFTTRPSGLVLVTGATGSGKSTTLAAMIDKINKERHDHILTVEDPIEFLHKHQGCMINQREVGSDTNSFAKALKMALRQDPDVVLIGEMRDLETIRSALTIAENALRLDDCRNRSLGFCNPAYQLLRADYQPYYRRVPEGRTADGAYAALVRAPGRYMPDPFAENWRWPRDGVRGDERDAGYPCAYP